VGKNAVVPLKLATEESGMRSAGKNTIAAAAASKAAAKIAASLVLEKLVLAFRNSIEFRKWHGMLGGELEASVSDVALEVSAGGSPRS
jgi:hypothetical protein